MSRRKLTSRQVEVMIAACKVYPAWYRARSNGERVTLVSLWRAGLMSRQAHRVAASSANNAYEYRPVEAFIARAREEGLL